MKKEFERIVNLFSENGGVGFLLFMFIFLCVKGNTFLSPLLLANSVDINSYGLVEFGLSFGMIFSGFIHLGTGTAYSYFNLKENNAEHNAIIYLHGLLAGCIGLVFGLLCFFEMLIIPLKFCLGIQIMFVFATQLMLSGVFRTDGKPNVAILLDGGLYIPVLIGALLISYSNVLSIEVLLLLIGLYQFVLIGLYILKWSTINVKISKKSYRIVLKLGVSIFISGVFVFFMTMGSRLLIEYFFDASYVGYYSFYYRLASVVVLVHQAANIFFFRKIYQTSLNQLDNYFCVFLILILVINLILFFVIPIIGSEYIPFLSSSISEYRTLYLLLCFQMPFWVSMALNENIIYREGLSNKFSLILGLVIAICVPILFVINYYNLLSLPIIVVVNIFAYYLVIEGQFYFIKRKTTFKFMKTRYALWSTVGLCYLLYYMF